MQYPIENFLEINEDMVQILLTLEVLFTQDSDVVIQFRGASSGSDPACSSAFISSAWDLSLFEMIFSMTLLV